MGPLGQDPWAGPMDQAMGPDWARGPGPMPGHKMTILATFCIFYNFYEKDAARLYELFAPNGAPRSLIWVRKQPKPLFLNFCIFENCSVVSFLPLLRHRNKIDTAIYNIPLSLSLSLHIYIYIYIHIFIRIFIITASNIFQDIYFFSKYITKIMYIDS